MSNVTIDDVADHADVSKSTVSAVLNDRDVVAEETRRRILEAIDALNYRPRGSARRGFRSPSGMSLGYVTKETQNPYYAEVHDGIQTVAEEHGYLTFTSSSEGETSTEKQIVRQFAEKDFDGLIITPVLNDEADLSHLFDLKRSNIPFVLLEDIQGLQAPLVDVDNVQASCRATMHLIELGHERIVHFGGPAYSAHSVARANGVRRAFSRTSLAFQDDRVVYVGDSFQDGYDHALDYFQDCDVPPTAITCYNDLVALGVMEALRELDYSVPADLSVVGFDDLDILTYYPIPLTTVRVPKRRMGREAATLLLSQIESETLSQERISLDTDLIVRSSTHSPPAS